MSHGRRRINNTPTKNIIHVVTIIYINLVKSIFIKLTSILFYFYSIILYSSILDNDKNYIPKLSIS
ncbi:hypothetical protein CNEO4_760126 [Clostridium neonatale]|nr:hypothetical protein CNEO3_10126 [Clostridium neonatale]CAI3675645.1 hypothetical protein CNEO4_620073 [Clostridium neonatale]CAI3703299.1 hypothetical protein CNEO4_840003 [Clostridium neonatale]CAI3708425.1 hypothetical protein CNEO4_760126 [Clostridium neonatale]CAI3720709.1 hypothetical protein CNEO4_820004 [Clostridium neonatale]